MTMNKRIYNIVQYSFWISLILSLVCILFFKNSVTEIVFGVILFISSIFFIFTKKGESEPKKSIEVNEGDVLYMYRKDRNPFNRYIYLVIVTEVKEGYLRYVNTHNEFSSESIEDMFSPMWYGFKHWKDFNEDIDIFDYDKLIKDANNDAVKLRSMYDKIKAVCVEN